MEPDRSSAVTPTKAQRTSHGGFSAAERKRFRKEMRTCTPMSAAADNAAEFSVIPTSMSVLSPRLMQELTALASAPAATSPPMLSPARAPPPAPLSVPKFKVGTLEMYRRHPEAYDAFMSRHDCSALQTYLLDHVMARIVASAQTHTDEQASSCPSRGSLESPSFVRVADFGCGTGRIGAMMAAHPAVHSLYAYDGEPAMLPRCLVNTIAAAQRAGGRAGVRVLPTATPPSAAKDGTVRADTVWLPFPSTTPGAAAAAAAAELEVVVRPCKYEALAAGFLTASGHAKCHLVVCAWSLSYLMRLQWGDTRWHAAVDAVVTELLALLDTSRSDAAVVIVETLGTGSVTPTRNSTLVQRLEDTFGFTKRWIRTDYNFASAREAVDMTRFFFGERIARQMEEQAERAETGAREGTVLAECTGIWTLWKKRDNPAEARPAAPDVGTEACQGEADDKTITRPLA